MTKNTIEHVKEFHLTFGHPVNTIPQIPDAKTRLLRVKLIAEEFLEFAEASGFPMHVVMEKGMFPEDNQIDYKEVTPEMDVPQIVKIINSNLKLSNFGPIPIKNIYKLPIEIRNVNRVDLMSHVYDIINKGN